MKRANVAVCAALAVAAPRLVVAAPANAEVAKIEARENQAQLACSAGRLQEGATILAELFAQTDDGTYIFNQARCYQQNGRKEEALQRFRIYLRRPDGDPAALAAARQYITLLEAPPPVPTAPTAAAAPAPAVAVTEAPAPADPASRLRLAGLVSGGTGLAALAAGAYFGYRTRSVQQQQDDAVAAGNSESAFYEDLNRRGASAERLQWVCLSIGAAAVSAGAFLYYLGRRERTESRAARLVVPLVRGASRGAILRVAF